MTITRSRRRRRLTHDCQSWRAKVGHALLVRYTSVRPFLRRTPGPTPNDFPAAGCVRMGITSSRLGLCRSKARGTPCQGEDVPLRSASTCKDVGHGQPYGTEGQMPLRSRQPIATPGQQRQSDPATGPRATGLKSYINQSLQLLQSQFGAPSCQTIRCRACQRSWWQRRG
jgi:hypothetical protein